MSLSCSRFTLDGANVEIREEVGSENFFLFGLNAEQVQELQLFRPVVENLLHDDPFLLLADHAAYVAAQDAVSALWRDPAEWTRKSILNIARMDKFSSDRCIRDYCAQVWKTKPVARQ
jgi:starch phosphorylase